MIMLFTLLMIFIIYLFILLKILVLIYNLDEPLFLFDIIQNIILLNLKCNCSKFKYTNLIKLMRSYFISFTWNNNHVY